MIGDYERSEALVLADEGRVYTYNPKDRGGPTMLGVTLAALSDYLGRPATPDEVKALTPAAVLPIYRKLYWAAVRGDELPEGLDYFCFDSAVQHGRGRAVKILQQALGVADDGVLGPATMAAIGRADLIDLIDHASTIRNRFYRSLGDFPVWGTGWINRLTRVSLTAKAWARKAGQPAAA